MGRLDGKVAMITGGASGLGAATATLMAKEGAHVVLADLRSEPTHETAEAIRADGGSVATEVFDVTSESDWQTLEARFLADYGRLDVMVNSAGITIGRTDPARTPLSDWRKLMAVNLDGVFLGTRFALRMMSASTPVNGSVINISSVMGLVALPGLDAYNASKGGVRLYTKSVALSCAADRLNIRANSIHPGFIDTPLLRSAKARFNDLEEADRYYDNLQPVGRLGRPEDIAFGALYLASDESSFVTGSELVIDGGYSAR